LTRVKTGISELDEMLGGGFMPGDSIMVLGAAGTGKTTLGLQYLVNGVTKFGENGVYVTFEELPNQIYRDANSLGWDLRKMEEEDNFRLVCTSPDLLLEAHDGEHLLDEPMRQVKARRIVIDPLSHLEMYVKEGDLRKEAYRLIMYLKTKGLSSLLTWESHEVADTTTTLTGMGVSFLVDCIIPLRFAEIDSSMRKALLILKMRGSDHHKQLREFEITSQGIKVIQPFSGYEGIMTGSPRKSLTDEAARTLAKAFEAKK
jgi:circadian clock protein KaiC